MVRTQRIYLDACALNRLTDPPSHLRISLEAAAIEQILQRVRSGSIHWIASFVLILEIRKNPDLARRTNAMSFIRSATEMTEPDDTLLHRGLQLQSFGFSPFDALHLASAEQAQCAALLTTDDRFVRCARRNDGISSVQVENPLDYLERVRL